MFLKESDDGEDHPDEEQKSRPDCIDGQRRVQESVHAGKDAKELIRDGLAQVPYRRELEDGPEVEDRFLALDETLGHFRHQFISNSFAAGKFGLIIHLLLAVKSVAQCLGRCGQVKRLFEWLQKKRWHNALTGVAQTHWSFIFEVTGVI